MAEGQGEEDEAVLGSLHSRELGLFCDHQAVRLHRRDRIGSEESFLALLPLSHLSCFPL